MFLLLQRSGLYSLVKLWRTSQSSPEISKIMYDHTLNDTDTPRFVDAAPKLKLYQAFVFSVPILFTFIILCLFYCFYLRRRRVDWSSLRMRGSGREERVVSAPSEMGLKKQLREMLPVIIFKERILIRETQCSVCLGDYESDDLLQQIPSCGHTFHRECIDGWLTRNTTCPLCRTSLLPEKGEEPSSSNAGGGSASVGRETDGVVQMTSSGRVAHTVVNIDCTVEIAQ